MPRAAELGYHVHWPHVARGAAAASVLLLVVALARLRRAARRRLSRAAV
jgi:hypothetical protein